jgi:hypothetical protein
MSGCFWQGSALPRGLLGLHPVTAFTMAAVSLAATSPGAFTHFETHELIEASDLTGIAERAQGIAYRPPGA